jgi:hypothetical protein
VLAIGPVPMMEAVAEVTRPHGIETIVSLNSIMVDGTGMCGGCRVSIKGKSMFACVDGPEFNAHDVDFNVLRYRNTMYVVQEREALARFEARQANARQQARCRLDELAKEASSKQSTPISR